jgi:uncharacterized protein (DUF779 family)
MRAVDKIHPQYRKALWLLFQVEIKSQQQKLCIGQPSPTSTSASGLVLSRLLSSFASLPLVLVGRVLSFLKFEYVIDNPLSPKQCHLNLRGEAMMVCQQWHRSLKWCQGSMRVGGPNSSWRYKKDGDVLLQMLRHLPILISLTVHADLESTMLLIDAIPSSLISLTLQIDTRETDDLLLLKPLHQLLGRLLHLKHIGTGDDTQNTNNAQSLHGMHACVANYLLIHNRYDVQWNDYQLRRCNGSCHGMSWHCVKDHCCRTCRNMSI